MHLFNSFNDFLFDVCIIYNCCLLMKPKSLFKDYLCQLKWFFLELAYCTVGHVNDLFCIFQPSDSVEVCKFNLKNEADWKSMSQDAVLSVCGPGASPTWPSMPPLCCSSLDSALVSNDLEQQLRVMVYEHRRVSNWFIFSIP